MNRTKNKIRVLIIVLSAFGYISNINAFALYDTNSNTLDKTKIEKTIKHYVDAYLNADASGLSKVFHPNTKLLRVEEGKLQQTTMSEWIKNINERKKNGDIRTATLKIVNIDITNHAAIAKLTLKFQDFIFTDYLSLLLLNNQWKIVGKIYDIDTLENKLKINEINERDLDQSCHLDVCYKNGRKYCCLFGGSNQ